MTVKEFFKRLWKAYKNVAYAIGWFNARIILTAAYVTVFFLTWLVMVLLGKDPLDLKLNVASAWHERPPDDASIDRARRLS